jgi:mono/diheme cytochrome c family protein
MHWLGTTAIGLVVAGLILMNVPARAGDTGEATFKAKCATCHGPDGKGDTPTGKAMKVKDLASEDVQKMSDEELSDAISKGKGKMMAFKTLTPEQVKDLVGFVRALAKKK